MNIYIYNSRSSFDFTFNDKRIFGTKDSSHRLSQGSFQGKEILSTFVRHRSRWDLARAGFIRMYLQNFTPWHSRSRNRFFVDGDTDVRDGGGKYIMSLVKLSFYDHFMVARDPSMLST